MTTRSTPPTDRSPPVPPAPPGPVPAPLVPPPDFEERAAALGIEFEPGDIEKLGLFLALLLETNKTHNLTAITDPADAWSKHILDALTLVGPIMALSEAPADSGAEPGDGAGPPGETPGQRHPQPKASVSRPDLSIIDVGSGGGLPAIPLAIVLSTVRFTLLEATGKKVEFLTRASAVLGLGNVRVIHGRAERIGQEHRVHRESYDGATARALGHLAVVAELTAPLVRPHGVVLAVKGAKADQEIEEARKAFGMLGVRHLETIPTPTGRVVVLEKTTRTPRLYPRKDGEPKRTPLGVQRARSSEPDAG
jgi:16S rRNA (guanine527-N7)-methyltransferase